MWSKALNSYLSLGYSAGSNPGQGLSAFSISSLFFPNFQGKYIVSAKFRKMRLILPIG